MNELESLLLNPQRKLLVTYKEIDLTDNSSFNQIFILLIEESKGSAGGRGGGSGYRKIAEIIGFRIENNNIEKFENLFNRIILGSNRSRRSSEKGY